MYEQRRQFVNNLISNNELVGLEIGGLDRPLVVRSELQRAAKYFMLIICLPKI